MATVAAFAVLGLTNALGILGLANVHDPWGYMNPLVMRHRWGFALAVVLILDIGVAGLLGSQVARFVPPIAGKTLAIIGGAAGFLAGVGAVVFAFDGIAVLLAMMDTERGDRIWVIPLIVITIVMLLAGGWAWESRKA